MDFDVEKFVADLGWDYSTMREVAERSVAQSAMAKLSPAEREAVIEYCKSTVAFIDKAW